MTQDKYLDRMSIGTYRESKLMWRKRMCDLRSWEWLNFWKFLKASNLDHVEKDTVYVEYWRDPTDPLEHEIKEIPDVAYYMSDHVRIILSHLEDPDSEVLAFILAFMTRMQGLIVSYPSQIQINKWLGPGEYLIIDIAIRADHPLREWARNLERKTSEGCL